MIEYGELKKDRRKFLALTGLTLKEFKVLLPAFMHSTAQHTARQAQVAKQKRQRAVGAGRRSVLATPEQQLLFILVYLKTYPLQVVMGELFDLSQPSVNQWIHRLLPRLQQALKTLGVKPERDGTQFARAERAHHEARDYIIDGTERRRLRPKNPEKQLRFYSGKQKAHSDKNVLIVQTRSKRVGYLSPTYSGKTHDKKVADHERIAYPRRSTLRKDTGFQGYEPAQTQTYQPKKSRAARN